MTARKKPEAAQGGSATEFLRPVIHDVTIKYAHDFDRTLPRKFTGVVISIRGTDVLALADPERPLDYDLIPLTSGNVVHVKARKHEEE